MKKTILIMCLAAIVAACTSKPAEQAWVKVEGNKVLLEGDQSASITITGQEQQGQTVITSVVTEIVKITSAGQTKVKGS